MSDEPGPGHTPPRSRRSATLVMLVCVVLGVVGVRLGYLAQRAGSFTELDYIVRALAISGVIGVLGVAGVILRRTRRLGVALLCGALAQLAGCFAGHVTAYLLRAR